MASLTLVKRFVNRRAEAVREQHGRCHLCIGQRQECWRADTVTRSAHTYSYQLLNLTFVVLSYCRNHPDLPSAIIRLGGTYGAFAQ